MRRSVLFLILVLALMGAACSGGDDAEGTQPPDSGTTATDTDAASRLSCSEPIRIGVITDLTGGLSLYGTEMERGVAIGMAYVSGGTVGEGEIRSYPVDDCEIEVLFADDQSNPEVAGVVADRLIDQGAVLLIGTVGPGTSAALRETAEQRGVILLAATDTPTGLTEEDFSENVFLVALSSAQQAYATCGYFAAALGAQTFAQIAPDYPAGRRSAAAYRTACNSTGGEFVTDDRFLPTATSEFADTATAVAAASPDALLITWTGGGTGSLLAAVAAEFPGDTAFGVTFPPDVVLPLFFDDAIGWTSPTTYHYTSPSTDANDYLVNQAALLGTVPDQYDAVGMNAALLAVAALRKSDGATDLASLRTALQGVEVDGPKGKLSVRATDHLTMQDTYIVRLLNTDDGDRAFYETLATVRPEPPCLLEGEAESRCE